jgi:hypothetical protein
VALVATDGRVPLVGRASEMAALHEALRSAERRQRSIAFATGEPGIGKTTLVDAFLDDVRARADVLAFRGTCVEHYGSGEAYLPVLEALNSVCRTREGEQVVGALAKYAPTWLVQMPAIAPAGSVGDLAHRRAGTTQPRMLRELAETMEALSAERPVVVVLEDLQWSDPSTVDLISILACRREPARLLIVCTYRPGALQRSHPLTRVVGELVAHRRALVLGLQPFSEEAVGEYLATRFPGHQFPHSLAATLHRSTGGNALFASTLLDDLETQNLIRESDTGWELTTSVEDVAARLPDNIRRGIDTQVGRLDATAQRVLEVASVAGLAFTTRTVAHVLAADADDIDAICEALSSEHRLLRYLGTETWPDGSLQSRFGFVHALFRQAALARIPMASLRRWHRGVAEYLAGAFESQPEEIAAELAEHSLKGEAHAKAAHYFELAGARAARNQASVEAVAHYERARDLIYRLPLSAERDAFELRLLHELGRSLVVGTGVGGGKLQATYERAVELSSRLDDGPRYASSVVGLQRCRYLNAELRAVGEQADAVLDLARAAGDKDLFATSAEVAAAAAFFRGRLREAKGRLDAVVSGSPDGAIVPPMALAFSAGLSWLTGRADDAVEIAERSVSMAERIGAPNLVCNTLLAAATIYIWRREPPRVEVCARRALEVAVYERLPLWQHRIRLVLAWAHSQLHPDAPGAENPPHHDDWGTGRLARTLRWRDSIEILARAGNVIRAGAELGDAMDFVEQTDERLVEAELHRLHGEILRSSDPTESKRAMVRAIDVAHEQGAIAFELRARMSLCRLNAETRRSSRKALGRLIASFEQGRDTPDLVDAIAVIES